MYAPTVLISFDILKFHLGFALRQHAPHGPNLLSRESLEQGIVELGLCSIERCHLLSIALHERAVERLQELLVSGGCHPEIPAPQQGRSRTARSRTDRTASTHAATLSRSLPCTRRRRCANLTPQLSLSLRVRYTHPATPCKATTNPQEPRLLLPPTCTRAALALPPAGASAAGLGARRACSGSRGGCCGRGGEGWGDRGGGWRLQRHQGLGVQCIVPW
mmetsp:Transcript_13276/g.23622  ORF Transcript_13276/g.23622 Transcript_13276/m.23622 type:complete len:219 (+) Transcript_13276:254-910(+)